jgi:hypothetical protein
MDIHPACWECVCGDKLCSWVCIGAHSRVTPLLGSDFQLSWTSWIYSNLTEPPFCEKSFEIDHENLLHRIKSLKLTEKIQDFWENDPTFKIVATPLNVRAKVCYPGQPDHFVVVPSHFVVVLDIGLVELFSNPVLYACRLCPVPEKTWKSLNQLYFSIWIEKNIQLPLWLRESKQSWKTFQF